MRTDIPEKFSKVGVSVETVGDLKKQLEELPDDLKIGEDSGFIVVFNVSRANTYLEFMDDTWA